MTRLDEMLQANEAYCKNPPVDYTDEDVHESKLRENPLLPKEESWDVRGSFLTQLSKEES